MKKWYKVTILVVVLVMSLAMAATALAAELNPGQIGATCAPGETGTWHCDLWRFGHDSGWRFQGEQKQSTLLRSWPRRPASGRFH